MFAFLKSETHDSESYLNNEQIRALHGRINPDIIKQGIKHAESSLKDSLETKAILEKKAFFLFNNYTLISMAIFLALGFLASERLNYYVFIAFTLSAFFFIIGAILLALSLKASDYGALGRYPDTWLQHGIIDGDNNVFITTMAHILCGYRTRISISDNSNKKKAVWINRAIWVGFIAISPIAFCPIKYLFF